MIYPFGRSVKTLTNHFSWWRNRLESATQIASTEPVLSFKRNLSWMALSQVAYLLLQFSSSIVVARALRPEEVGIYTVATSVVGLLSLFQAFGLSAFLVREPELTSGLLKTAFTLNLLLSIMISGSLGVLSVLGANLLHEDGVRRVLLVLCLVPILGAIEFLPSAMMERSAAFKTIGLIGVLRTVTSQFTSVALVLSGFSYMSLAYGQIAAALVGAAAFCFLGREHMRLSVSVQGWQRMLRFGVQMLLIQGVNSAFSRAAEFALARLLGLSALGLYSRATNLNNLVWENIHLVIGRVLFVDLSAQRKEGKSLRTTYLKTVEVLTTLLWPAFVGLAIVAGPFVRLVYGERWVAASHPLILICLSSVVLVSITMTWEIFVACRETARQARIEIVRTATGFALFCVGCLFGLTGAAAGRLGESVVSVVLYRPHLDRMTDTSVLDLLRIYFRAGALTLLAILPALSIMLLNHFSEYTSVLQVVSAIGVGMALWLSALILSRHLIFVEAVEVIRARSLRVPRGFA